MNKGKLKLPIKTYLLYLIMVAVLITGASFARYTTSVNGGDSISVAKPILSWDLSDGTPNPVTLNLGAIKPGDNQTYGLKVTNQNDGKTSDVAIDFSIVITITDNLPLAVTLKEDKESGKTFTQDTDKKITTPIQYPYTFNVGSAQEIKFELKVDWAIADIADGSPNYAKKTDTITIKVVWSQKTS